MTDEDAEALYALPNETQLKIYFILKWRQENEGRPVLGR